MFNLLALSPSDEIVLFISICEYIKTYKSFFNALALYEKVYYKTNINIKHYYQYGTDYYTLIHKISNSYIALHKDYDAQNIILKSLNKLEYFFFESDKDKDIIIAKLYNRLCVTYKSLNIIPEAEKYITRSIDIAKKNNDIVLELKNYIDYGYLYYKRADGFDNLNATWGIAINKFFKYSDNGQYDQVATREVSTYFHASILALIDSDYERAEDMAQKGLFYAQMKNNVFNEIKLLLIKSIINILKNKNDQYINNAEEIAYSALDKCIAYNSQRSYWVAYHLLGKISFYKYDSKNLQDFYLKALEQLEIFVIDEVMENNYIYFFDDLALAFKKMHIENTKIQGIIKNNDIKKRVMKILNMDEEKFYKFFNEYKPMTPITDGRSNFPLP